MNIKGHIPLIWIDEDTLRSVVHETMSTRLGWSEAETKEFMDQVIDGKTVELEYDEDNESDSVESLRRELLADGLKVLPRPRREEEVIGLTESDIDEIMDEKEKKAAEERGMSEAEKAANKDRKWRIGPDRDPVTGEVIGDMSKRASEKSSRHKLHEAQDKLTGRVNQKWDDSEDAGELSTSKEPK